MGNLISLANGLFHKRQARIVMIGLDGAGKTTILNNLRFCSFEKALPTIGFNVETIRYKRIQFDVWDLGGQDELRPLWEHYFDDADALIYVVDSNDKKRIEEVRDELKAILNIGRTETVPLLLFCNKLDFANPMSVREIIDRISLRSFIGYRHWFAQGCCAATGEGIYEGLQWLSDRLEAVDN